jgi:hypothetical protein
MKFESQDAAVARWAALRCSACGNTGVVSVEPGAERVALRDAAAIVKPAPNPRFLCDRCWRNRFAVRGGEQERGAGWDGYGSFVAFSVRPNGRIISCGCTVALM